MKEGRKEGMSPLTKMFFDLEYKAKEEGMNEGLRKGRDEGLRKGMNEGLRKGRNEGIKKGILNMAKKMIERKMEMKEIEEITGLTKKELQNLVKN